MQVYFNPFNGKIERKFLDEAAADALYLRLDTANDPMQGNLDMGGFTFYGNSIAGGNLVLDSTSNATKGYIQLGETLQILKNGTFTNAIGVISWGRSSMYEQTGATPRVFIKAAGDRQETLSEDGGQILFSANGANSALPSGLYTQFGFRAGLYDSTTQNSGGMMLSGDAYIGSDFITNPGEARLHVRDSSFPTGIVERTTTSTNILVPSFAIRSKTTGNMTDGFAAGFIFQLQDNSGVVNNSARIYARRDGNDATARFAWYPGPSEKMTLRASGYLGLSTTGPTSMLHVKGTLSLNLIPRSANYTLAEGVTYPFSCSGGNVVATLPASVDERIYIITRVDTVTANSLTLTGTGGDTIDGQTSIYMAPGEMITVQGDGANWYIIERYKPHTVVEIDDTDSPYTVPTWVDEVIADTDSGNVTVNLYAGASNIRPLTVKNAGTGTLTVDPDGAELIYGAATETLIQYESFILKYHTTKGWV